MNQGQRGVHIELNKDFNQTLFLLKKSSDSSNTTVSIQADFSPPSMKDKQTNDSVLKTLPIFNLDSKYYTPSFVLQMDKPKYEENQAVYLTLHNRKTTQISEQKTELFVPKPSKNNSFCCICKTPFEDYLTHLNMPKHQFLMKKSEFYLQINDLCCQFNAPQQNNLEICEKKRRGRPCKNKGIEKAPKLLKKKSSKGEALTSISTTLTEIQAVC